MSIPRKFPFIEQGDVGPLFEAWRATGFNDSNTDRGLVYVKTVDASPNVTLQIFKDAELTQKQSEGTGLPNARITAAEFGGSGLEVSAFVRALTASSTTRLWLELATMDDVMEREDDARTFLLRDPPEVNFSVISLAVMRRFYLLMQADIPPPQSTADPLSFPGTSPIQISGRRGLPDVDGTLLWTLNRENDWELTGLQNAGDWKEWAITYALHWLWKRKGGSQDDPNIARAAALLAEANDEWTIPPILVDADADRTPDREVRIRTSRLRRG